MCFSNSSNFSNQFVLVTIGLKVLNRIWSYSRQHIRCLKWQNWEDPAMMRMSLKGILAQRRWGLIKILWGEATCWQIADKPPETLRKFACLSQRSLEVWVSIWHIHHQGSWKLSCCAWFTSYQLPPVVTPRIRDTTISAVETSYLFLFHKSPGRQMERSNITPESLTEHLFGGGEK